MHLRRPSAALATAVLAMTPVLAGCGFDNGTDQPYTPGAGIITRADQVVILSAVIVSSGPGEGTFIATLANQEQSQALVFDSVQGAAGNTVVPADVEPVTIAPGAYLNLATEGRGVKLQGSFVPGNVIPLSVGFEGGLDVETDAVVVRACDEYAGLDPASTPSASSDDQSATPTVSPTDVPSTGQPDTAVASQEADETGDPAYACEYTPDEE